MNFLDNINNNTLIIANNALKNKILDYLNKLDKFINVKIMNSKEFFDHYFFSYDLKTIIYLEKKYNLTIEMSLKYLNYLKYIIDVNINDSKIKYLKEIYNDLKDNNLLIYDLLFKNYLNNVNFIVLEKELYDNFSLNIFNKYNVKYIDLENINYQNKDVYHFDNIEDECAFVFNEISKLLKNGVNYSNIKIIPLGKEYNLILKRFSLFYNIKLNNLENISIYSTEESKKFLNLIKSFKSREEIYEYLKPNLDKELTNCFLNIINKYYFINNLNDVYDNIIYDLKNTYFENIIYKDAIDIINWNYHLINDDDYVFVLGFNLENCPKTYKDIDYLNDKIKNNLNIFTSYEKNKLEKKKIINNINYIKNLTISYKDNDPYNKFYKSNLIKELNMNLINVESLNETSNLYNKVKLANELDLMLKYGIKFKDNDLLLNTYKDIKYLTYVNDFTGIDKKYDNITLSYTSINNFYHCSFKYYIENILNLNIYEESFKQFIGTLFHNVLLHMYDMDFNFNYYWNDYIKDKEFTKKELFYLKDLKKELIKVIDVINYQYKLTGLTNLNLEKEIIIKYDDKHIFKGIIDKIMFKEKDNNTYISIIDYKTGTPKVNMSNLKYGIDMQLPIYVYLILKSSLYKNPKIIGFYLEQILTNKKENKDKVINNLKLQGYSINDQYLVSMFDESYKDSKMIKSMKITKSGFGYYSKVLSEEAIIKLFKIVEDKVKEAFDKIENNEFTINPKIIGEDNIGCSYCKYHDLCFKTGKDDIYLKEETGLDYLNK